ncbi:MAG: holo-ACP synthase [Bacteroidota bacterium]
MYCKKYSIINIEMFRQIIQNKYKPETLFTKQELKLYPVKNRINSLAGRFLIKKCIIEYLSCEKKYNEIEVINDDLGKPVIKLHDTVKKISEDLKIKSIYCSISHSKSRAAAMVIFNKR